MAGAPTVAADPVTPSAPGAGLPAYVFKGAPAGARLPARPPEVTDGPEKGRVVEMQSLSTEQLGGWVAG